MRDLDAIKSTKFEAEIQYLNVFFLLKTHFALVIKINKI